MPLVAVARHRATPGVHAPGYKRPIAKGQPKKAYTYDWRERPGSEENTAGIRASLRVTDLEEALSTQHKTDAHVVGYVVAEDGVPLKVQPRVNKSSLAWMHWNGYDIRSDVIIADVDNAKHGRWTPELRAAFDAMWHDPPEVLTTTGVYLTLGGYRIVQPLDEPLSVSEIERYTIAWLAELAAARIYGVIGTECKDWTRLMRLPNVRRDGKPFTAPLVDLSRMVPRVIEPAPIGTTSAKKPRTPRPRFEPPEAFATQVDPEHRGTAELLAAPLANSYSGERHQISLALAAVLLDHGVSPAVVPALVAATAGLAGWDSEHHRANAEHTIIQAANGMPLRKDIPPALAGAVRRVFNVPTPVDTHPTPEASEALYSAIMHAPDGPSVVVAGCGTGKSHQARRVALERSKAASKTGRKTVISAPTNELAIQYVEYLRGKGVPTLRVFGPATVPGDHDGFECRYARAAQALAAGGQSARWELCEGRGQGPCSYQLQCKAYAGQDGSKDARVVVGNHGLVTELDDRAGKLGLLILDEPPAIMADEVISQPDLENARRYLDAFVPEVAWAMRPIIERMIDAIPEATIREVTTLEQLTGISFDAAAMLTDEKGRKRSAPQLLPETVRGMRFSPSLSDLVGKASRVLRAVCWAYMQPDVNAAVYTSKESQRYLALTGLDDRLTKVLRRDGRVVVMAADADLHVGAIERATCVQPPVTTVRARDGCTVRRVHLYTRGATRRRWIVGGFSPGAALAQALAIVDDSLANGTERVHSRRVLVVTFLGLVEDVRKLVPAGVQVHHYGGLRGIDTWSDFDAVVTLGDHYPNLDHVSRTGLDDDLDERAAELCAAELEQAHGRLRTVHRSRPCTQVHVGRVRPRGWPAEVEDRQLEAGRPPRDAVDTAALREVVTAAGGVSAVARLLAVSRRTVHRWLDGTSPPEVSVVSRLNSFAGLRQGV